MLVFNIHQLIKLLLTIVIIVERVLVIFVDSEPRLLPSVLVNMLACLIRDQVLLAGELLHLGSQSLVRRVDDVLLALLTFAGTLEWVASILAKPLPQVCVL